MARTRWALPVLLVALIAASPAQATLPQSARVLLHHQRLEPHRQLRLADHTITYAAQVLSFLKTHRSAGTLHSRAVVRRDHTWLREFGERKKAEALSKLDPYYGAPPHRGLWLCLHDHEAKGDWHNRDTGHNGHYGGLQMSWGWLGIISGSAADMTPVAQMWAAERGYRASGFSSAWLWGQWGQTLPYCTSHI